MIREDAIEKEEEVWEDGREEAERRPARLLCRELVSRLQGTDESLVRSALTRVQCQRSEISDLSGGASAVHTHT